MKRILASTLAVIFGMWSAPQAMALDGKWNVDAAANWSAAASWTNSQIADGAGFIANFEFNITADRTVTLDSTRTIGRLRFQDATTASHNWTLAGSALTLNNSGSPATIEVANQTATISAPLAGTTDVQKTGGGTLILSGANTYNGRTILSAGFARVIIGSGFGALPGAYVADRIIFDGGGLLNQDSEFTIEANRGITINAGGGRFQAGFARSWAVDSIIAGAGTLTISADSTPAVIYLNGANTHTGELIVNNNTAGLAALVAVNGSFAPGGRVRVTTNGWLTGTGVLNRDVMATNGATINPGLIGVAGTLTINGSLSLTNAILNSDLSTLTTVGGGVNDLLQVNGDLNLSGLVTVRPGALAGTLATGTYRLINYTGTLNGSAANLVADAGGYTVTFDTSTPGEVTMIVSDAAATVVWTGQAGPLNAPQWDVGNFLNFTDGITPVPFLQGQNVVFDDTGAYRAGAIPVAFNMVGPSANFNSLLPASVTVDTTNNVTFHNTGTAGKLSGPMTLTKRGPGLLALTTANGNFPNDFTGPAIVEGGILRAGYARAFGSTNVPTIATNGGTIDVNGQSLGAEPFIISGAGVTNTGAIINSGGGQNNALRYLTLAGDATVGGVGRWDVRNYAANNLSGARVFGNGYSLIKTGLNQVSFVGVGDTDFGNVTIEQGTLGFEINATLGRSTSPLTIKRGATLLHWASAIAHNKPIQLDDGGRILKDSGNAFHVAPFTLLGGVGIIDVANNSGNLFILSNRLEGAGSVAKAGAGVLQLFTNNSHTGGTIVSNGTLLLFPNATLDSTAFIDIRAGAFLDVTRKAGLGGLPLGSGQALSGAGSVLGGINAGPGSFISPGTSPGTLSINSNLTLNGATVTMELGSTVTEGGGANDLITVRDLNLAGPTTVRIVPLAALNTGSPYVLARYTNSITGNPLDLTVVSDSRYTFTPDFGTANLVQVTAVGAAGHLVWQGGTLGSEQLWDINTTANWTNLAGAPEKFFQGDIVAFDDSSLEKTVTITSDVYPSILAVNAAADYLFAGPGGIEGAGTFTKAGTGKLTLANGSNAEFTGPVSILAGTLELGNGGTGGDLGPAGTIANNGTLMFNRSDSNAITRVISGTGGALVKNGTGVTTLAAANSFSGSITVNSGVLRLAHAQALGNNALNTVAINPDGQLDLGGASQTTAAQRYSYTAGGYGPDGRGALINSGATIGANSGVSNLTLTADTALGTYGTDGDGGRFDVGGGGWGLLDGGGFRLIKLGHGRLPIRTVSTINLAELVVSNGLVYSENFDHNLGANVTVYPGGTIAQYSPTGIRRTNSATVVLEGGAIGAGGQSNPVTNVWTGPIVVNQASSFNPGLPNANAHVFFLGPVSGPAPITVLANNSRLLDLYGTNDGFAGGWIVVGGGLLRAVDGGTFGAGAITNYGTVDFMGTNPVTQVDVYGTGLLRHLTGGGTFTLDGTIQQANIQAQGGSSNTAAALTFAPGSQAFVSGTLSAGHANTGGRIVLDNATVNAANFFLGEQASQTGHVAHVNATVTVTNQVRFGHWPTALNTYTMDGGSFTVTVNPAVNPSGAAEQNGGFYIGVDGVTSFTQIGGALTLPAMVLDNRGTTVLAPHTNTYNLNGGTLTLGRWGMQSPNTTYQINLGGGTVAASQSWTSVLRMTLTGTNGATTVNPGANTIGLNGAMTGPGGLVKEGAGSLFMTNAGNNIAGNVLVNDGTLLGNGILGANLDVVSGATLAPGASPGIIIATNATLGGTLVMELSRSGQSITNDRLVVTDTLTLGGALQVVNIGQPLVGGEVFDLLDWGFLTDTFATVTLPALPSHLAWDSTQLYIDGTLRVVGPPTITLAPVSQTVYENDNVFLRAAAEHMQEFDVRWQKDGMDIPGATSTNLVLTNVSLSAAGTYTIIASNASGAQGASATLTVLEATNLQAGLIAYWPLDAFDTGNNRTLDATSYGQHLQGFGIQASNVIAGVRGNAFSLNGSATNFLGRYHVGGEALPAYQYQGFTVAMWVRGSHTVQNDRRVFAEGSTNSNTPLVGFGTHPTMGGGPQVDLYVRNNDGGNPINHLRGSRAAFDGNWHHVTLVDNNGSISLYVDGQFDTNIVYTRGSVTLNTVAVGGLVRAANGVGFVGDLDEVMVWRRALSSNDVVCAMTNGLVPPVITSQPASTVAECSSNVTFTVGVTSVDPATYQWFLGVNPILDATNASLELPSVSSANNGSYSVLVRNCAGDVWSDAAVLTVQDTLAPVIICPANIVVECAGPAGNIVTYAASATDGCEGVVPATCVPASGSSFTVGTVIVTCSANDSVNNTNTCAFSVTVVDTMPPAINCPPPVVTAECTSPAGAVVNFSVTAGDTCDAGVTIVCLPPSGSQFAPGATTVNCAASDDSLNTNTCSFMVNVVDTTPPVLTCPAGVAVQCDADVPPASFAGGSVTDNCDAAPVVTHVSDVDSGSCPKTIVRTYRATDASGHTNDCAQTITVHDTTAPVITCPAPLSVQCPADVPLANVLLVSASDNCDPSPVVTHVGDVSAGVNPTIITRTYRATDSCGNTNDCAQTITVLDTMAPVINTCASSVIIVGDTNGIAIVPDKRGEISATDNCAGALTITQVPAPGSMVSTGIHVMTFTAIDSASNTSACTATLNIVAGAIPPTILTEPQDATVECGSNVTFTVSVDGTPPFAYQWFFGVTPVPDATNATLALSGVTAAQDGGYSVIITNDGGSITSRVATLIVTDSYAPTVVCPGPIMMKTASTNGAVVTFAASAGDSCTPSPMLVCTPTSGSLFPVGATTVNCVATDGAGNSNACSFLVTILYAASTNMVVNSPVPDIPSLGLVSVLNVQSPIGVLSDVNVTLNLSNGWNGDLFAYLVHESGYTVLLNRAGKTALNPLGYSDKGMNITLDDQATNDIHTYRFSLFGNHTTPLAGPLTNAWQPDGRAIDPALVLDTDLRTEMLASFNGTNPNGEWILFVEDDEPGDTSTLVSWGLELCGTLGVSPVITNAPQNLAIDCGVNAVFTVGATGTGPVGYHWARNGVPIPGATGSSYTIPGAVPTDSATYSVIVSNAFGTTAASATLVVTDPNLPVIVTQPQSVTNNVGTTATLTVAATSCSALTYQWCFGLTPLAGQTNATLMIPNIHLADQGGYSVKVSNAAGTVTSAVAVVTVNRPPIALNNGGATTEGQPLMIQLEKLLANDTDADGDPLTVVSVTATSTNGGSVVLGGGKVTYTPLPAFSGMDRFSYTISDGRGGFATADVEVLVVSGGLPSQNQIALIPTPNGYLIRFAGIPGYSYLIQRAESVTGPWTTITTQTAPLHGIIEYEDVNPPPGSGFYRTVAP